MSGGYEDEAETAEWEQAKQPGEPLLRIDLSGVILRPGDTLVLASKTPFTDQHWHVLSSRIKERLPDVSVLLVEGIDAMAAYRPEDET